MNKIKKLIFLNTSIVLLVFFVIGITYTIFQYNMIGGTSEIILGDIYIHYNEVNQLIFENATPSNTYTNGKYFEFSINGKNTYAQQDVLYDIVLNYGDDHNLRNTRIKDNLLMFRLVEVIGTNENETEKELIASQNYDTINGTKIWTERIPAETNNELEKKYRLYMWISDETLIGNTSDVDYSMETWNNQVYASVKVNVIGSLSPPVYTINYYPNFSSDDLNDEYQSQDFTYGIEQNLNANPYVRDGYIFVAWNTSPDGSGVMYDDLDVISNLSNKNGDIINLYAIWDELKSYNGYNIYDMVKDNAVSDKTSSRFVLNPQGIDFGLKSGVNNGKGVYLFSSTENDTYPTYYYRGDVKNNNVIFANYCWKIVRTTETGGTKLFFNGSPVNGICNNTGSSSQLTSKIKYNSTGTLESVGYASGPSHTFSFTTIEKIADGTTFSNDVSYVNGQYILNDDRYIKDSKLSSTNLNDNLKTHHYTCLKNANEGCSSLYYIYMIRGTSMNYIILKNGEKIEDVINNELSNSTNINPSSIKTYIDDWYSNNMTNFTTYLEDTIWCSDRSISVFGGWNKNLDVLDLNEHKLNFGVYNRMIIDKKPSLTCKNLSDRFTVNKSNGNGNLTYPTALLTIDEVGLAGYVWGMYSYNNYLNNDKIWWTMTPTLISANLAYIGVVYSIIDNVHSGYISNDSGGVRPAISLKYGIKIKDGYGTSENPFILEEI